MFVQGLIVNAQLTCGPVEFNSGAISEFAGNFSGGIKKGFAYYGVEQFSLNLNFENAHLWKGGNLFIHALNIHGRGPTHKFVGDMMYLSNIEADNYFGLYEFWYSQQLGKSIILFGQHDLNTEFAGTKYGENFIHSSYGVVSSVLLNVPLSIYPVAAPCILVKYSFTDHLVLKLASYDGDPGNMETNKNNVHWYLSKEEGFMNIAEIQYIRINHNQNGILTSKGIQMGTFKFGMYYHSGSFPNYKDTLKIKKGNYGLYFIADQMIIPKPSKPGEGLAMMVEIGMAPSKFNLIAYSIEAGIRYHGIIRYRTKDFIGLAFSHATLSRYVIRDYPARDVSESSLELSYKFQFSKHYTIQPDFQYIIHPGALKTVPNSFAGLIRVQLSL